MFNVLQNIIQGEVAPNKVTKIKSDTLQNLPVLQRDEALILYGPDPNDPNLRWEIVLLRPLMESKSTSFSLYRCQTEEGALIMYNAFLHRVPKLTSIVKEYYNVSGLQKLCDTLVKNPSWSMGHLMVYFNLTEYVRHKQFIKLMDCADHEKHMSPLQLAVKTGNTKMVKMLLPICKIEHLDNNHNSSFHYAAESTKEIINCIAAYSTSMLNHRNTDGNTALHLSCLADKPECVKALLIAGANVNIRVDNPIRNEEMISTKISSIEDIINTIYHKLNTEDMKNGGTPLHWTTSKEVIEALIDRGVDVNVPDFHGRSALHIMVMRKRLDCVLALLANDIKVDLQDNEGKTALHIAIENKLVLIVQALIVFGCDINETNMDNVTPRHMVCNNTTLNDEDDMILYILNSVGANRCSELSTTCPAGCNATGEYNGIPPKVLGSGADRNYIKKTMDRNIQTIKDYWTRVAIPSPTQKQLTLIPSPAEFNRDSGRLLCLDGGGIRGLVLIQMLLEIEKLSRTPVRNMFDWMAGTSTGGILVLGMAMGRSVKELQGLYWKMKDLVFVGSRPYPSEVIEKVLQEFLGTEICLNQIQHPNIIVIASNAKTTSLRLHLFRNYNYDSLENLNGNLSRSSPVPDVPYVWEAARATSAAPSYFRAYKSFLDDGLIANNPTLYALTEIHRYNKALGNEQKRKPVEVVLSLGTGFIRDKELNSVDIYLPQIFQIKEMLSSIIRLAKLAVNQLTESNGSILDTAKAWCKQIEADYCRFNPQLSEDVPLDEKDDQKLINMMWQTKAYMYAELDNMTSLVNLLQN